jgi:hypothetical protein
MFVFMHKWLKKTVFTHLISLIHSSVSLKVMIGGVRYSMVFGLQLW